MLLTLTTALLPVFLTLVLGYFAAMRGEFSASNAKVLTRLVMHYALPMALFAHVTAMPRDLILTRVPLGALLFAGMMGPFIAAYFTGRWLLRRRLAPIVASKTAMITALCLSAPSIPFVGVPVLGQLYGANSGLIVSLGGLIINLVQLPLALLVLAAPATDASAQETRDTRRNPLFFMIGHVKAALREPVVWAPLLALGLTLGGVHVPVWVRQPLHLLAVATGGVALFATGIVLQTRRIMVSFSVGLVVLIRNLVIPLAMLGLLLVFKPPLPPRVAAEAVVTLALPTAALGTILAVAFQVAEREAASILFFSTLCSAVTLPLLLWLSL
ncbi:AEC family transporter [Oecophyllibacter saccharovorans]|uniref:AEC family transporter n=1 Tax=Oecophyllibacter saccharovorans TaxID=2558360 RepID=UPI001172F15F|nr:AEC family transporter [Oecophyllibacter saccharovorans]TPW35086.1 permease [Oecophyllibacter saccharovorans]